MFVYLYFLLIFFAVPVLIIGWYLRKDIKNYRRTILWCLVFVYTIGLLWDWLSFKTGVWRYDSAPTVGIWIDGLPAEEFIGFYLLGTFLITGVTLIIRKKFTHV